MPNTSQCWKNQRDRRYERYIKPVRTLYSAHSRTIESFISLFLSPRPFHFRHCRLLLFSELPSCISNSTSFFSSPGIESRVRIVSNGHLPISDIRLPATAFHFALTINYRPPISSLSANIPDLIISGVIFVLFKQPCGATRALRERVTCPSVELQSS